MHARALRSASGTPQEQNWGREKEGEEEKARGSGFPEEGGLSYANRTSRYFVVGGLPWGHTGSGEREEEKEAWGSGD